MDRYRPVRPLGRPMAFAVLGVLVAACAAAPSASVSSERSVESETAAPSVGARPTEDPGASAPAASVLGEGAIAEVVTTDLVMRSLPGVTDESQILDRVLQPGERLFVMEGPVHATFYDWYHVQPIADAPWPEAGWAAAASREGEPWIAAAAIDCPRGEQFEADPLAHLHPLEALSCFGDRQIQVRAQAMGICSGYVTGPPNFTIEPAWLGNGHTCQWNGARGQLETLHPHFSPPLGTGYPAGAERLDWYILTGQFDHPDAAGCELHELAGGHPQMPPPPDLDAAQIVLLCRSHFAVVGAHRAAPPEG